MISAHKSDEETYAVAEAQADLKRREPFLLKLGNMHRVHSIPMLALMTIGLIVLSIAFGTPILTAVMIAYLIGIMRYVVQRQEHEFDLLRYVVDCDEVEADRLKRTFRHHPRSEILMTWAVGPVLMTAINFAGPGLTALREGTRVNATLVWGVAMAALFWVLACQMMLVIYNNSRTFGMLGRNLTKIDLLNRASLVPFARVGIRNLLVYFGAYALLPLIYLHGTVYTPALFASLAVTIPFAVLTLLIPILPVHRRIKQEKTAELDRIQLAMHGNRAALDDSAIAVDAGHVGFTDLMLYRQMIEGVREWPIDAPVVVRLGIYVVIPLLTWFGAAIVEHVVARIMP
jgi:hypothetical protein